MGVWYRVMWRKTWLRDPVNALMQVSVEQDRRDALNMSVREDEKRRAFSFEAWQTHRREWFPSGWGLS
jgi:hypothetical protein